MKKFQISNFKSQISEEKGQVIIVAVLVLLSLSLMILAASARSLIDLNVSQTGEDSAKAFSAAEAGVETAIEKIKQDPAAAIVAGTVTETFENNATFTYEVKEQSGTGVFLSPSPLASDITPFQVHLDNSFSSKSICLLWGNPGVTPHPAIEAIVIYGSAGTYTNERFVFDPDSRNGLPGVSGGCSTTVDEANNNLGVTRTFAYSQTLSLKANPVLLRLRLLFTQDVGQYVGVDPVGQTLPVQGHTIIATGKTASGSTHKLQVFQTFPAAPIFFDYVLFNGSNAILTK